MSYSNYPFAMAMPTERTEAILAGLVEAFAFFGCAPHEVWWDNPNTVVRQIFRGRDRRPSARYAALASHYAFDPRFCMPARGNAKPSAETRVRVVQRQVPSAAGGRVAGGPTVDRLSASGRGARIGRGDVRRPDACGVEPVDQAAGQR